MSDGRAGLRNQVQGLAEAIAQISPRPIEIKTFDLAEPWRSLPLVLTARPLPGMPFSVATPGSDRIAAPWPRVFIGCGRASIALSLAVKARSPETFTVQAQDPRISPKNFDLVVPPLHDQITGGNVFPIIGSPNRVTPAKLSEASAHFASRFEALPRPRIGVLIGGSTKHLKLTQERTTTIAAELGALARAKRGSLALTTSRRTGAENAQILTECLSGPNSFVWDGSGDNPYFGILALCDFLIVTEDSVNMATESAATGKPIYVLSLDGRPPKKFQRFHSDLRRLNIARPFEGKLEMFSYTPLNETERAASEICWRAGLARS